jgi:hypothetical protein
VSWAVIHDARACPECYLRRCANLREKGVTEGVIQALGECHDVGLVAQVEAASPADVDALNHAWLARTA